MDYLDPSSINGLNLYAYCNNDPVNYCDPDGHMSRFGWWILGAVVVAACLAATIISAGGFAAGGVAICSAMCGIAYGTAATTISSFAFVGAATVYAGAIGYNILNIATAEIRGSSYIDAYNDALDMGDDVFAATLTGGLIGGIGGAIAYDDQLRGLNHSWATERRHYLKKHPEDKGKILHHLYGRAGANIRYYYPVTVEEHKMIHHELGYGRGQGGFYQYREWINWWKEIFSRF